jgi:hypothetical protein
MPTLVTVAKLAVNDTWTAVAPPRHTYTLTGRSRKHKRLFAQNRGFAVVNDGPAFASQLAHYLTGTQQPTRPWQ